MKPEPERKQTAAVGSELRAQSFSLRQKEVQQ